MSKMTIYKLAKELNMTPSMISRAFSPSGKVSKEKRDLILETARKYDFVPNRMASRLSMRSIHIGVVINSGFSVNAEKMLRGIERSYEELKDYKISYNVTLVDLAASGDDCRETLMQYADCDGIIVAGFSAAKYTDVLNELYAKNHNVVQVQAVNEDADCLFSSKHDEKMASSIAAEFLANCLKHSSRKNILLFTGNAESKLHIDAREAFENACKTFGLNLLKTVSSRDNTSLLQLVAEEAFAEFKGEIDGIYTTSGVSDPICECIEKSGANITFVAFDTHEQIKSNLEKGIISATISQDITMQMKSAFDHLIKYIINDEKPPKTVYTDVQLVLKSNMHLFN